MPDWKRLIRERLGSSTVDAWLETDVAEELGQHLEDRYQELLADGMPQEEACRLVEAELDSNAVLACAAARQHRNTRPAPVPLPNGGQFWNAIPHLLRNAYRSLRARPGFSWTIIAILALGIGGNTAIFSVFNSLYLRPLPFPESGRLVDLDETAPKWNLQYVGISNLDFRSWQRSNSSFDSMAFFSRGGYSMADGEATLHVQVAQVTHQMLNVLRLDPALGRNFTPDDDTPNSPRVALLSYQLWQREFHGDPAVVGRAIHLNEEPYTVVGVLPSEAVFPDHADLWLPLAPNFSQNSGYYLSGIGRLRPGVSIAQARGDLLRIHKAMILDGQSVNKITSPVIAPLRDRYLAQLRNVSGLLMCAVGIVLLIACLDISALLLVRGAMRSQEIAIRMAVGASRGRIAAQLLTENLVLALLGGAIGVFLGEAALRLALVRMSPMLPRWIAFSPDWRFSLFCLLLTGGTALLFGIGPAVQCTRVEIAAALGDGSIRSSPPRGQRTALSAFVVCQIAFALLLSIGAGLLLQAFNRVQSVDPGFNPKNVLLFQVNLPQNAYGKPEQTIQYGESLLARLQALPGIQAAAATSSPPLGGHWGGVFEAESGSAAIDSPDKPTELQIAASPRYFEAVGTKLLAGRYFNDQDSQPQSPPVVIVNESFARHFWGSASAIGKRIRRPGSQGATGLFNTWNEVVGLVQDERHDGLDQKPTPAVFLPFARVVLAADPNDRRALQQISFVLRTANPPESLVSAAREAARQVDPNIPIYEIQTLEERLDSSLWARRAYSWLFEIFAVTAILLSMAGVYGTMSYSVSQRMQEFGIRMALGADAAQVLRLVLGRGAILVAGGLAIGLANALWSTNLLRSLLFGVSSHDVLIYSVAVLCVGAAGLAASVRPAIRAFHVDPIRALRNN